MLKKIVFLFLFLIGLSSGLYSQNKATIDSLRIALKSSKDDFQCVILLNRLSWELRYSRIDSAEKIARKALALSEKIKWQHGIGYSNYYLGYAILQSGNYKDAVQYLNKAREILDKSGDNNIMIQILENLGWAYQRQSDYPNALNSFFKAISLAEETGAKKRIADQYAGLAWGYSRQAIYYELTERSRDSLFTLALNYGADALKIDEELKNEEGIARDMYTLGFVNSEISLNIKKEIHNLYDSVHAVALNYYRRGVYLAEKIGNIALLTIITGNMGHVHFRMAECALSSRKRDSLIKISLKYCHQSLEIHKKIGLERKSNVNLTFLGTGYFFLKKYGKAREYYDKALVLSERNGDLFWTMYIEERYSQLQAATGNYEKALYHYKKFYEASNRLLNQEAARKQTQVEMQYFFEKEKTWMKAEEKNRTLVQNKELERQREQKYFFIVGGIMLLVTAFILINRLRYSKKMQLQMEEKNLIIAKEKEIAEDHRNRAEQSEKFKQRFLANMSHEIRTPMNAVMGMTNILLEKTPGEEQRNYLERIRKSSENLLVIINDILDLSKIEEGKMELESIDFSIKETVNLVLQTLQFKAEEKGLELKMSFDEKLPAVFKGDPTRLNQILTNLAGNAIKFTEKGCVTISVTKNKDDAVLFEIRDTGIGMTQEQIEKLFTAFQQADSGINRKYGGTGLGLSISKQLVELHKGTIKVESEYGKGTVFSFAIPYNVSENKLSSRSEFEITQEMIDEIAGIRILLAEDNEYNRIVATDILKLKIKNVVINEAYNGKEAISLLKKQDYDLILMDVQMPVMDGFETTLKIRNELKNEIPIIAMTASVLRTEIDHCMRAGMDGYVPKPFRTSQLLLAIYKAVKGQNPATLNSGEVIPAENKSNVTDLTFLTEFCEGDELKVKKYVSIYLNSAPKNLAVINNALNEKDYETLRKTVHQLKTHLRYMGMQQLAKTADIVEENCVNNSGTDTLPAMIAEINSLCRLSFNELS